MSNTADVYPKTKAEKLHPKQYFSCQRYLLVRLGTVSQAERRIRIFVRRRNRPPKLDWADSSHCRFRNATKSLAADSLTMSHYSWRSFNCFVLHHVALEMHRLQNSAIMLWVRLETNIQVDIQQHVVVIIHSEHYCKTHIHLYAHCGIYGEFMVCTTVSAVGSDLEFGQDDLASCLLEWNCWPVLIHDFRLLGI